MKRTTLPLKLFTRLFLLAVLVTVAFINTRAQTNVEVSYAGNKTVVSIKNFPKNSTILIVDENLNLLSVTSTNNVGAATLLLNAGINGSITARTIHGDREAVYKFQVKENTQQIKVAITETTKDVKA